MKAEIKIRLDPDGFDAAELLATVRSPGFYRIQERMRAARSSLLDSLVAAANWDETRFIQGQLCALDRALAIPEILRHEAATPRKKT